MRKQPVIWATLCAFKTLFNALPHRSAVNLGGAVGRCVHAFSRSRAARAYARVMRILDVDEAAAQEIVRAAYDHFGRSLAEFIRLPKMASRLDEIVELHGEEHLRAAMEQGHGVIFLAAHIGCWEYGAALLAQHGFPVNAIGAEQRDPRITETIERLRASAGVKPVGKGMDLRAAIDCLRKKEILCVLLDQDAREAGVVAPFLGFPASTPIGPLKMAKKFGSPVVPAYILRNPDGVTMTMHIEPALATNDGSPFGSDLLYAATACNDAISRWIRMAPGQWMWMYPRWATTLGDR